MTPSVRLVALIALLAGAAAAHAQSAGSPELHKPDDRRAAADALFREGLDLMTAGKYAEACAKFSASHRFDPSVGALLNLGNCHETLGQYGVAFELFVRAAEQAREEGDGKRARYAEERQGRLEGKFAWVIVEIPEAARLEGLEILRSGAPVAERWWNRRAPIDPGAWTIRAQAPGARPFETRIEVERVGQEVAVRIPVLEARAPDSRRPDGSAGPGKGPGKGKERAPAGAGLPGGIASPGQPAEPRDHGGMSLSRKLALGSAAAGAVAVIGGSVLGLRARGLYLDARDICDNDRVEACTEDERGRSQAGREDARSTANLATISFAIGTAAVAAGVILWVMEPGASGTTRSATRPMGRAAGRPATRPATRPMGRATRIQPVLSPDGAGIKVHLRF